MLVRAEDQAFVDVFPELVDGFLLFLVDGFLAGVVKDELVDPASVLPFSLLLGPLSLAFLLLESVLLGRKSVGFVALLPAHDPACVDWLRWFLANLLVIVVINGLEMAEDELDLVTGVYLIGFYRLICYPFTACPLVELPLYLFLGNPDLDAGLNRPIPLIFILIKNPLGFINAALPLVANGEDVCIDENLLLGVGLDAEVAVGADLREMDIFFDFRGVVHNKNVSRSIKIIKMGWIGLVK